jgi:hypothetical protein
VGDSPDWSIESYAVRTETFLCNSGMEDQVTTDNKVMSLLAARIPVTLLLDLAAPPDADEIYVTEGGSADWLDSLRVGAA